MRALDTAIGTLFGEAEIDSEPATVRGIAASPGTYTGTARVISGPEQFVRLQPGDVLVTVSTTLIHDGALVRVDGRTGAVEILE